ncbi:MAG TPA: hypothetical protein VJT49_04415 [Amycolatopsis sp.]|uniref:hypothetical protein n=1 Tax=Amycolatopsis sp. TaxID=37632 RepID=UPI002B499068|nr:hypothetical protein [Amycolatopsis sp.]HKS44356.1 hypothetical protein [Amycolatopsis sp.]
MTHTAVRHALSRSDAWDWRAWGVPINNLDAMHTQAGHLGVGFIDPVQKSGIRFSDREIEDIMALEPVRRLGDRHARGHPTHRLRGHASQGHAAQADRAARGRPVPPDRPLGDPVQRRTRRAMSKSFRARWRRS